LRTFVLLLALFLRIGLQLALALLGGLVRRPIIGLLSSLGALVAPRAGLPLLLFPIALSAGPGVLLVVLVGLRILVFLLTSFRIWLGGLPGWICLPLFAVLVGLLVLFALLPGLCTGPAILSRLRILAALLPGLRILGAILTGLRILICLPTELRIRVALAVLIVGRKWSLQRLATVPLWLGLRLRLAAARLLLARLPGLRALISLLSGLRVLLAGLPGSLSLVALLSRSGILLAILSGLVPLPLSVALPGLFALLTVLPGLRLLLAILSGL